MQKKTILLVLSAMAAVSIVTGPAAAQNNAGDSSSVSAATGSGSTAQMLREAINRVVRIRTRGRGEFQGTLMRVLDDRVELRTGEGLIQQIALDQIVDAVSIDEADGRDTFYQDAAANKLIIIPLGFGMDPGELHIADQEIIVVNASYGVSQHLSFWGAVSIPGLLFNARVSFCPTEKIGISAGALGVYLFTDNSGLALPYLITSFGTENQNFTFGFGAPVTIGGTLSTGGAAVFGGKIVISQTAGIITENWVIGITNYEQDVWTEPEFLVFPMIAVRIAGSRFSWDIGVTMPLSYRPDYESSGSGTTTATGNYRLTWLLDDPIPIPILAFTYRIR